MKLKTCASGLFILIFLQTFAQETTEKTIKKVADFILSENFEGLKVASTADIFTDFSKLPADGKLALASRYRTWEYWNGVLNTAMLKLFEQTKDEKYRKFALGNYAFIFDNFELLKKLDSEKRLGKDVFQLYKMGLLDHCGSMASGLIEAYKLDKRTDYRAYLDKVADYILNKEVRLEDGTLARLTPYPKTLWLDDLYMSVPFLSRMGKLTGDRKYFDFAAKQIKQFNKYLYDPQARLYYHAYYADEKEPGVAHWGRANGWCIVAQVNLLEFLPKDHPDRPELLRILKQQITGLARYQSESGLWHQVLDRTDSYLETSCTAMFTYSIAKAVNEGWIEPRYKTIAEEGWKGIETMIAENGQVRNICMGTGTSTSMVHYYKRPTPLNDIHGLGAVLLAGIEVMKLPNDAGE